MSAPPKSLAAEPLVRAIRDELGGAAESVWIVGGSVRDALLGRPVCDLDLVVTGDPEPLARAAARALRGHAFRLSERFGAWRVVTGERDFTCDLSPRQGETIEQDLAQRDFSINAMAVPLVDGEPLDPFGGRADLAARRLRVLGGPRLAASAYAADPLRPLRLVRLATELGFEPDPATAALTREAAGAVTRSAGERVFAELRRIVCADAVLDGLALADRLGLVAAVLPELARLHGVEQSHFHHLDVHGHTLEVLARQLALERDPAAVFGELAPRLRTVLDEPLGDRLTRGQALRFAALLHDIGKPATRALLADGRVSFIGHDTAGERIVDSICLRLRTGTRLREFLGRITRHHLVLGFMVRERPLSAAAAYRYLSTCSPVEVEVTALSCADRLATRGRNAERAIALHLELARELLAAALDWRAAGPPRPAVAGDELAKALQIEPGPELGSLLERLAEARYTGEARTREEALELARRISGG